MANLPPIFILIIEVAMGIVRKCQKDNTLTQPNEALKCYLILYLEVSPLWLFITIQERKFYQKKMPHICTRFYNKLCTVSEKVQVFITNRS